MKVQYTAALAIVAFGLGTITVQGLYAQAKPPVYVVIDIDQITDAGAYKAVADRGSINNAAVKDSGGHYLARTKNIVPLEGTAPQRVVIIAFDSVEKAKAYFATPVAQETLAIRTKTTKSREFIVEGMSN
jgi:uncharacterized protein (DUF1330 family)